MLVARHALTNQASACLPFIASKAIRRFVLSGELISRIINLKLSVFMRGEFKVIALVLVSSVSNIRIGCVASVSIGDVQLPDSLETAGRFENVVRRRRAAVAGVISQDRDARRQVVD